MGSDPSTDEISSDLPPLDLPAQADPSADGSGVGDDVAVQLSVPDVGDDPFDDAVADDLPIDVVLSTTEGEPSAIGDDATGLDGASTSEGVHVHETEGSLIDPGDDPDSLDFEGDDSLGIDPIPREVDDGGLEGVDDPGSDRIEDDAFPPLDGDEEDNDATEIDLGIDIEPPPPPDTGDDN